MRSHGLARLLAVIDRKDGRLTALIGVAVAMAGIWIFGGVSTGRGPEALAQAHTVIT
jgi:phage gpG-like protein